MGFLSKLFGAGKKAADHGVRKVPSDHHHPSVTGKLNQQPRVHRTPENPGLEHHQGPDIFERGPLQRFPDPGHGRTISFQQRSKSRHPTLGGDKA